MVLALLGMSGSGKSLLASRLVGGKGFERWCVDDDIENLLRNDLGRHSGLEGIAHWMGMPYDEGFATRQDLYLNAERAVLSRYSEALEARGSGAPHLVIDTTGSFIYCGEDVCARFVRLVRSVYLMRPDETVDVMLARYLSHPKPVVWGNRYTPFPEEARADALARLFKALVESRDAEYRRWAHYVTVCRAEEENIDNFLASVGYEVR